jgi:hypothetical protein
MFLLSSIKRFKSARVLSRAAVVTMLCVVFAAMCGCGKPFNVKTRTSLPPANYAAGSTSDNISIQAQALRDEDFLYETFDANLIAAGVLPVRVMVNNSSGQVINLDKARFEIRQPNGRGLKTVDARKAFKKLIAYYEISLYNKAGYKESLGTFSEYAVDMKTPLEPGQSRQGLMFFLAPGDAAREAGLTLVVSRLGSEGRTPVELKLN